MIRITAVLLFSILPLVASGLDFYWVGGTGNWSDINNWATTSGGTTKHITVPSPNDNVFFDANSFNAPGDTVYVDLPITTTRNLTVQNVQHSPVFHGGGELKVYGSFTYSKDLTWSFSGTLFFEAVQPGFTISTDDLQFNHNIFFQGIGGSWTLLDDLSSSSRIYLIHGSFNTNGKTLKCNGFYSTSNNQRSLQLGSSNIFIENTWSLNMQQLTFDGSQSRIFFEDNSTFNSTGGTSTAMYNTVVFYENGVINGNKNFDTLLFSKGCSYSITGSSNITGYFQAVADCNFPINITGSWNLSMPVTANFDVYWCHISGINASGGATFIADQSTDGGGNSGITFIPVAPLDLYWVGGSGNWHDTLHWSYTSGGSGGACLPTYRDNVWFDANSLAAGDVVIISSTAVCKDMHWVNIPDTVMLSKSGNLEIHGSMWLNHYLIWNNNSSETRFVSDNLGETITTDGVELGGKFKFDGDGSWTFMDDFFITDEGIEHVKGTLSTNSQNVTILYYTSTSSQLRTLDMGSTYLTIFLDWGNAWQLDGGNFTLNAGTSTIDFNAQGAGMENTATVGFVFNDVIFSDSVGTAVLHNDSNIFNTLTFNSNGIIDGDNEIGTLYFTKGNDYTLYNNKVQVIINDLVAIGGCDGYILIHSDDHDEITYISKSSGTINCEYLILWNVYAIGGATFNAFNSFDIKENFGWNFTTPPSLNLYWVGGTGEWSDTAHWSYTSGGPGGACVPSPIDSVFFDSNSFINNEDTVFVDIPNATCYTMTWKDTLMGAVMHSEQENVLWIWGSLIFSSDMNNRFAGNVCFEANTPGHIIVSDGNQFNNNIWFQGRNGQWTIMDSLNVLTRIFIKYGSVDASERFVKARAIRAYFGYAIELDISDAHVEIIGNQQAWFFVHDSLLFDATNSLITFSAVGGTIDFINNSADPDTVYFHDVEFTVENIPVGYISFQNMYGVFNVVSFNSSGRFDNSNLYDSLLFAAGGSYAFEQNTTQTFNYLDAEGNCFKPIDFVLYGGGTGQFYLHGLSPAVEVTYVNLGGCHGVGPATYTAYSSFDNGGNTNWTITPVGPVDLYWVNGTGTWWDPYHWSYSSGGPGGACIPTHRDNVFFDQNSFITQEDTVLVDGLFAECNTMQWININTTPSFILPNGVPLRIHGSLRLDAAILGTFNGVVRFMSKDTGNYIYFGAQVFSDSVVFHGDGGGWIMYDSLVVTSAINLIRGHLNTNSQHIRANLFYSVTHNERRLELDSSVIVLNNLWRINGNNLTFDAGKSVINFIAPSSHFISENGQGFSYHNLNFTSTVGTSNLRCNNTSVEYNKVLFNNNGVLTGEHLFDSFLFMPGNLYRLEAGRTQTIVSYWLLRGNNCFPLTLQSSIMGHQAFVTKSSGQVIGDFLHIRDIDVSGGATFFAGDNSSDVSNNSGWDFSNSPGYVFGLGDDILFTIGSSVTLSTVNFNAGPGTTFLWSTGDTTSSIIVTQPGTYYVTVTYAENCVVVDSIRVYCDVEPDYIIGDNICYGDSTGWINTIIVDTVATYTAQWSHGATQLNVAGLKAGQYIVTITGSTGCDGIDTLYVDQPPPVIVPLNDTSFCEDDTGVLLDASPDFINYWWNGLPGSQTLFVAQADTVTVQVEDADGCFSVIDTLVITIDTIPHIWLGDDQMICLGEVVRLSPGDMFDSYLWQDGSTNSYFYVKQGGAYYVTIKLRTCYNHDTVIFTDCPPELEFPNVFTPNGDGINDYFYPINQNIINYKLVIFDRWGNVVFETDNVYDKWDGNCSGRPCSEGTYYYTVEYEGFGELSTKGKKLHSGIVTLLR